MPFKQRLTDSEFLKLSTFIHQNFGIKLPLHKKLLLEGRLQKRLGITYTYSFKNYVNLVLSEEGRQEIVHMIDEVSTNMTDFFRESKHFDYLRDIVLTEFMEKNKHRQLRVWSAASSTGEEIYTIAITIEEFNRLQLTSSIQYHITGTDISVTALKKAIHGVYHHNRIVKIPNDIKKRYFLKNKDPKNKNIRIVPLIRNKVRFERLNLMKSYDQLDNDIDVVFCRNVLIYFNKIDQHTVVKKICEKMVVGGYLFLGHSESIIGLDLPLKQVCPTVYVKI